MSRIRAGSGSVFQRTYRVASGTLRKARNWYVEFVSGTHTVREPRGTTMRRIGKE